MEWTSKTSAHYISNWFALTHKLFLSYRSSEVEFIRNIVEWISEFIYGTRSIFPEDGLVGIGSRVEEMNSYLGIKSSYEP